MHITIDSLRLKKIKDQGTRSSSKVKVTLEIQTIIFSKRETSSRVILTFKISIVIFRLLKLLKGVKK